jgi:hypothetical protein
MVKIRHFVIFLFCLFVLCGCAAPQQPAKHPPDSKGIDSAQQKHKAEETAGFESVKRYIQEHGKLPDNFITKNEAKKLGWDSSKGNLSEVAPGKSIGGDRFYDREKRLPYKKGRTWHEADMNYHSGRRGSDRLLFSNDGLFYKTTDHYRTFTEVK